MLTLVVALLALNAAGLVSGSASAQTTTSPCADPAAAFIALQNEATTAAQTVGGGTVTLTCSLVTPSGQSLSIPATGTPVTLDLDGYDLTIASPQAGAAAIELAHGAALVITDTSPGHTGVLTAAGGAGSGSEGGGAGIGTDGGPVGGDSAASGSLTVDAGSVIASGGNSNNNSGGGAGIGSGGGGGLDSGGNSGAAAQVILSGGSVTAAGGNGNGSGGLGGPGIGAGGSGVFGSPGSSAGVAAQPGPGASLSGEVAGPLNVSSGATLAVPASGTLSLDGGGVNDGTIQLAGTLSGGGTLQNLGAITLEGSAWSIPGYSAGAGTLSITGNVYKLDFDLTQGTAPAPVWVFAPTIASSGVTLPAPPAAPTGQEPAGTGWQAQGAAAGQSIVIGQNTLLAQLASVLLNNIPTIALTPAYQQIPPATPPTGSGTQSTTTPSPTPVLLSPTISAFFVPHVSVLRGTLHERSGQVSVRLRCRTGATCHGSVRILVRETSVTHYGTRTLRRHRLVVIGSARFSLAAGHTARARVRLNARGRHALMTLRRGSASGRSTATARLRVTITAHAVDGNSARRVTVITARG